MTLSRCLLVAAVLTAFQLSAAELTPPDAATVEKHYQAEARRFHEQLRDKQTDIERLQGEVRRLSAVADMCEDRAKAASAALVPAR